MVNKNTNGPGDNDRLQTFLTTVTEMLFHEQDLTWSGAQKRLIYLAVVVIIMIITLIVVVVR
jgi:hypothetical protein